MLLPLQGARQTALIPRVLPWVRCFCPFRACGEWLACFLLALSLFPSLEIISACLILFSVFKITKEGKTCVRFSKRKLNKEKWVLLTCIINGILCLVG